MNSAVLSLHYVTRVGKTEMLLAYLLRKIITTYGKYILTFVFKLGKQSLPRGDRNMFKVNVHRKRRLQDRRKERNVTVQMMERLRVVFLSQVA